MAAGRGETSKPSGVYVHWPFAGRNPDCDFNSHVRHAPIDESDLPWPSPRDRDHAGRAPGREVSSILLGGGTPSLMRPRPSARFWTDRKKHWRVAGDVEVTLEANPTASRRPGSAAIAAAGVNRVSLGVQALDDVREGMGRLHTARERSMQWRSRARRFFGPLFVRPDLAARNRRLYVGDELKLAISEAPSPVALSSSPSRRARRSSACTPPEN